MKRSLTSKKKILIIILSIVILSMAIGYSAFSTLLNINGTAEITTSWDVEITNVVTSEKIGDADNREEPKRNQKNVGIRIGVIREIA